MNLPLSFAVTPIRVIGINFPQLFMNAKNGILFYFEVFFLFFFSFI